MAVCRQPMGPAPITSTVSPSVVPMSWWQAWTELEWLTKGTLREAQRGWHLVDGAAGQSVCGEDAVLGQPAVEAGGDADHGHVVAEVVEPDAAVPALEAVHVRSDRQVVADLVAGDLRDPTSVTTPANSWPGVVTGPAAGPSRQRRRSEPHTPHALTASSTPSSGQSGTGMSTSSMVSGPVNRAAFTWLHSP